MPKIFTIGFSGKSPDAFMDVLNAIRVRAVWDIRLWRVSTYTPFYSGDSLSAALGDRYEYHPEFTPTAEILTGYKNDHITWADYERINNAFTTSFFVLFFLALHTATPLEI